MIDDVASRYGGKVYRSPVGEINVVQQMHEVGANIGGEGNGGVIFSPLHYGRDAVLGIAMILQLIAKRNLKISDIASSIPQYSVIKEKIEIAEKDSWIEPVKRAFAGEEMDLRDGIKIIFSDSWVHIRESNTEPIVRIFSEAPTSESAKEIVRKVYRAIS